MNLLVSSFLTYLDSALSKIAPLLISFQETLKTNARNGPHFNFPRNLTIREEVEFLQLIEILGNFFPSNQPNRRVWLPSPCNFSCKSFYSSLLDTNSFNGLNIFKDSWEVPVPMKIKVLLWCPGHKKLNTNEVIQKRKPWKYLSPMVLCL